MKKMISVVGIALTSFNLLASSYYANGRYWYYTVSGGQATITDAAESSSTLSLEIPSTLNGYKVVAIADHAFSGDYYSYCRKIRSVSIPSTLKTIGKSSFGFMSALTSVTIPESVETIDGLAFEFCAALAKVTFLGTPKSISSTAFRWCDVLKSVKIPGTLQAKTAFNDSYQTITDVEILEGSTTIGDSALKDCKALKNISIPDSVKSIGPNAFNGCVGLVSMTMPASVTSIGDSAFYSCQGLRNLTISPNVKTIGSNAFSGCSSLTSVTIPAGCTTIGACAFYSCSNLKIVYIRDGVTSIGDYAFAYCPLSWAVIPPSVTAMGNNVFISSCKIVKVEDDGIATIPDGVKEIPERVFVGCNFIKRVVFPDSLEKIGDYAFAVCEGLEILELPEGLKEIGYNAFQWCTGLTSIVLPVSLETIDTEAFIHCSNLKSVRFLSENVELNFKTFYECANLESIVFEGSKAPDFGLAYFDYDDGSYYWGDCDYPMFEGVPKSCRLIAKTGAKNWTEEYYGTGLRQSGLLFSFADDPFAEGGPYDEIVDGVKWTFKAPGRQVSVISAKRISDSGSGKIAGEVSVPVSLAGCPVVEIGCGCFSDCRQLTSVAIPEGVRSIGSQAFMGCGNLSELTIPHSLLVIEEDAFGGCLSLGNGVVVVDDCLLTINGSCSGSLTVGSNVRVIANKVLSGRPTLSEVVVGAGNQYFCAKDGVLYDKQMEKLIVYPAGKIGGFEIPEGVKSIQSGAFTSCAELTSIKLPCGVEDVPANLFQNCKKLASVEISEGLNSIGEMAFANCEKLSSVVVPNSVKSIGAAAFSGCSGLTKIVLPFIGSQRGNTGTADSLFGYVFGQVAYNGAEYVEQFCGSSSSYLNRCKAYIPSKLEDVKITDESVIGYGAFYGCKMIKTLSLPNTVRDLGAYAFYNCSGLGSITVPANIGKIESYAFEGCKNLKTVLLNEGLKEIGGGAFQGCSGIEKISIPPTVETIGNYAFFSCNLNRIIFNGSSAPTVGGYAFYGSENSCLVCVKFGSTGWGVEEFPGAWKGMKIDYYRDDGGPYERTVNGVTWNYTVSESRVTITRRDDYAGSLLVPESISCYDVVAIGKSAFRDCVDIQSVTLPASMEKIGASAFDGCNGLKSVTFLGQPPIGIDVSGLLGLNVAINGSADISISPQSGTEFKDSLTVELSTSWANSVIRYTMDGSDPTGESAIYEGSFVIRGKSLVKAATFVDGYRWSPIASAIYSAAKVETPVITSSNGSPFRHAGNVIAIACQTEGVEIRYTLDGSIPTVMSKLYEGPFEISQTTKVRAIACRHKEWLDSDVAEAQFVREWDEVPAPEILPMDSEFVGGVKEVEIRCDLQGAKIYYTINGDDPSEKNGRLYKGKFTLYGSAVIKAIAFCDDYLKSKIAERGYISSNLIGEALNVLTLFPNSEQDSKWVVDTSVSHDGISSVRSPSIGNSSSTQLSVTVSDAGRFSFWWKTACEENYNDDFYDFASVYVDGVLQDRLAGVSEWKKCEVQIAGSGTHSITWVYAKDDADMVYPDCVWIDQISWIPADGSGVTVSTPVPVPYSWLEKHGLGNATDFENEANGKTGKVDAFGRELTVVDDYIAGTDPNDPESKFTVSIKMLDGKPVVTWSPALNGEGVKEGIRSYSTYGSDDLQTWHLIKDGEEQNYQFFKVDVGLP